MLKLEGPWGSTSSTPSLDGEDPEGWKGRPRAQPGAPKVHREQNCKEKLPSWVCMCVCWEGVVKGTGCGIGEGSGFEFQ